MGIVLDTAGGKMYFTNWTNITTATIQWANLDGSNVETLATQFTSLGLMKGIAINKKEVSKKDKINLIFANCLKLEKAITNLNTSPVYISVKVNGQLLYDRKIPGKSFILNQNKTKYKYREKSPEKHNDILIPQKKKMKFTIKRTDLGEVSDLKVVKLMTTTVTISNYIYVSIDHCTVNDNLKRTKYKLP